MTAVATQTYRHLEPREIEALKANGCTAADWPRIKVADGFKPEALRNTHFSGDIRLGRCDDPVGYPGGAGIINAALRNCTIGDNVLIHNIGRYIANYDIGDKVVIDNVGVMETTAESTFGNGTEVEALNEAGGREITIFDRLSSQIAYLLSLYRHRPALIEKLEAMIGAYVDGVRRSRGTIGAGARITDTTAITNVKIGPAARISGALRLSHGTVNSSPADPATIGAGVIAENFITCSGSKVDGGAIISNCFIGQGAKIGRQYSAENSVFFANAEGFHGEACAIFAG